MPMPTTCVVSMWLTRSSRLGMPAAKPLVRRLVTSRRNTPDLVHGSRNLTALSAQMFAPPLSAAHASASVSSIRLANSGGVNTSSFERFAMNVSTSGLRPRSAKPALAAHTTRRLIDLETHRAVFIWVQQRLAAAGLLKGRTIAIDATILEANAAMRSIVRRDTGEDYQAYLTRLAAASGIKTPTREALARCDRKRKKQTSNKDWRSPSDPDAKVAKMKDGRTHLAHKAEHAVDLDSGALVAVTLQDADQGDTTTLVETAITAAEQVEAAHAKTDTPGTLDEIVADKGYHSNQVLVDLAALDLRTYIAEPDRGRRTWRKKAAACTRTGGAFAAPVGWRCSGTGADAWNVRMRISTRPAA